MSCSLEIIYKDLKIFLLGKTDTSNPGPEINKIRTPEKKPPELKQVRCSHQLNVVLVGKVSLAQSSSASHGSVRLSVSG